MEPVGVGVGMRPPCDRWCQAVEAVSGSLPPSGSATSRFATVRDVTDDEGNLAGLFGPKPLMGVGGEDAGAYEPVVQPAQREIAPGESVELRVHITGYGRIDRAKFGMYAPPSLLDSGASYAVHGIAVSEVKGEEGQDSHSRLTFGGQRDPLDEVGASIVLLGVKAPGWERATTFFDTPPEQSGPPASAVVPHILSEQTLTGAPIVFHIQTKKDTKPATYFFQFYLTYHNGYYWNVAKTSAPIVVTSWYQRNLVATWAAGIGVAVLGLVVAIVLPIIFFALGGD